MNYTLRAYAANPVRTLVYEFDFAELKAVFSAYTSLVGLYPVCELTLSTDEGTIASGWDGYEYDPKEDPSKPYFGEKIEELTGR